MKTLVFIICLLFYSIGLSSQNGVNYKALIKDASGNVLTSSVLDVQFTIFEGASLTNNVYQETHTTSTDVNGFVILIIGEGTSSDDFSTINWGSDEHFLNVQIDIGSGFVDLGTTQFNAVPYALHAQSSSDNQWTTNSNGINTNNNVGINRADPEFILDARSTSTNDASQLNISNSDKSRYIRLFSGSQQFPDPSVTWAPGNNLLFAEFNDNTFDFSEKMRISSSGNVGIGTPSPDASAVLDLNSSAQGVLVPRLTLAQINAIVDPETSLLVYQTNFDSGFYYNSGTKVNPAWVKVGDTPELSGETLSIYTPGSQDFTVPNGVYRIYFEMVAGGGGSGGTYIGTTGTNRGGGGGGGGGFASGYINVTPGEVLALVVGNRGTAGTSGTPPTAGTDGGDTTISSGGSVIIRCTGGRVGQNGTSSLSGSGGFGGGVTNVNTLKVKRFSGAFTGMFGSQGLTTFNNASDSLDIIGNAGSANNVGSYNRLNSFFSTVFVSVAGTINIVASDRVLPFYGVGVGRGHGSQGGYIVLSW